MAQVPYRYYYFGSDDSIDTDVMIECPTNTELTVPKDWNANLITIENGLITQSLNNRGRIDAVHNSLYYTYDLHTNQVFPCPLTAPVKRLLLPAIVDCIHNLLIFLNSNNSNYKEFYGKQISKAYKNGNWSERVSLLHLLKFDQPYYNDEQRSLGMHKSIAFDVAQTLLLIKGKEVYTKKEIIQEFPELEPIIYRRQIDFNALTTIVHDLGKVISSLIIEENDVLISYDGITMNRKNKQIV
jgi:hypothetical protein